MIYDFSFSNGFELIDQTPYLFRDQRITQDVDKFTNTYCEMLPKIIMAPFVIAYYSYKAYVT